MSYPSYRWTVKPESDEARRLWRAFFDDLNDSADAERPADRPAIDMHYWRAVRADPTTILSWTDHDLATVRDWAIQAARFRLKCALYDAHEAHVWTASMMVDEQMRRANLAALAVDAR